MRARPMLSSLFLSGLALLSTHPLMAGDMPPSRPLSLEQVMADPDWIGPAVEDSRWSLDGSSILYRLKRTDSDLRDDYRIDLLEGGSGPVPLERAGELDGGNPVFDASGRMAAFVRDGDLFLRDLRNGTLRQLTRSEAKETSPRFSLDGRWLNYQVGTDAFRINLQSGLGEPLAIVKLADDPNADPEPDLLREHSLRLFDTLSQARDRKAEAAKREAESHQSNSMLAPQPFWLGGKIKIEASAASPDGHWLLLVTSPAGYDAGQTGKMTHFVTDSGYNDIEDVRTRVGRNDPAPHQLLLLDLQQHRSIPLDLSVLPGIKVDPLAALRKKAGKQPLEGNRPVQVASVEWNDSGSRVAIMLRAVDSKDRWIAGVDFDKGALTTLHRLHDDAWINWNFNEFGWLPNSATLWYDSEESGNSALYTRDDNGKVQRRVAGDFEVSAPQPSRDGSSLFFIANQSDDRGDYEVYRVDLEDGRVTRLSDLNGVESFRISPDGRRLLVRYSGSYLPTQIALVPTEGGDTRKLTDTRSEAFKSIDWQAPKFVQVPSSHFKGSIPAKLYLPAMEAGKTYPVVMFVHGAGYTQNVHHRYPYYFREQMFHNLLNQEGFIVLDMDYRASEGYGRDWRTAIYRQMGHPELDDYLDGIDWLVKAEQADRERVGIYGGSYGGFMSLIAMFRAPDAFKAGAALRPVSDWINYNHEYTSNILNTPDIDPEAYRTSSPIEYADGLKGRLLIAHGMLDDNVFYQDSVHLAQKLIELHKGGWELASYPMEHHGFVHADSWYDEYRRIHELMLDTLKPR